MLEDATTKPTRRIKAADFLTGLTGGYPPQTRTLTLLLDHPALTVPGPRTGSRPVGDTLPLSWTEPGKSRLACDVWHS
ncbi:hypothetical protein [Streptomyces sp. R44]|uniref:Uncharacterized protein n=1 Tax=Streptomyces sp. R44 TaxID=3238633 RepID=A0AB39SRU3_9ACTN